MRIDLNISHEARSIIGQRHKAHDLRFGDVGAIGHKFESDARAALARHLEWIAKAPDPVIWPTEIGGERRIVILYADKHDRCWCFNADPLNRRTPTTLFQANTLEEALAMMQAPGSYPFVR